ncbi:MAG: preprotein translocase subunit SecE [Patescibacteria group bacterium]|nr:preprotein translocase subunit SecE [Patescibacteria group bacterium]
MSNKIIIYLKESFGELKKVNWLTWKETLILTINILLFSALFLIIYWVFDFFLLKIIFINR